MIAENKAYRDRIQLGLLALPLLQVTGLIRLLSFNDFPYHFKVDAAMQLFLQNVPLSVIILLN